MVSATEALIIVLKAIIVLEFIEVEQDITLFLIPPIIITVVYI